MNPVLGRRKAKAGDRPPVFVDMSVFRTESDDTVTVRALHIYEEKDLRLIRNSIGQGHIVTVDTTVYGGDREGVRRRIFEIADASSSTVCEAGPGVYIVAPLSVNVERMRAR